MSALGIAVSIFFTSKPSIAACKAQIGSISVTVTLAPAPLKEKLLFLFQHHRILQQQLRLPAIIISVARRIASTADSLQPYLLSNLDFVTESLTLIAGIGKVPF